MAPSNHAAAAAAAAAPEAGGNDEGNCLWQRLTKGLEDEELVDVELVGDDEGNRVPASRFVLACASKVLKRMLLGSFSEASSHIVRFPSYKSTTLGMVVRFCATDKVRQNFTCAEMMEVARFAHAFDVPDLMKYARKRISSIMNKSPARACLVYNRTDESTTPNLHQDAWNVIAMQPRQVLKAESLLELDPHNIQTIFQKKDELSDVDDMFLFEVLSTWYTAKKDNYHQPILDLCKDLARTINLTAIQPLQLKERVLASDIVDADQVNAAFMAQAIEASRHGFDFSRKRPRESACFASGSRAARPLRRRRYDYRGSVDLRNRMHANQFPSDRLPLHIDVELVDEDSDLFSQASGDGGDGAASRRRAVAHQVLAMDSDSDSDPDHLLFD